MNSVFQYIRAQLKQKFIINPIKEIICTLSPVIIFIICFIVGKCSRIEEENSQTVVSYQAILMAMVAFSLYIVLTYKAAYDVNREKKIFRKQHMYTNGFGYLKFYFSWAVIYALIVLPTSIIIVGIVYIMNIFPNISVVIQFFSFYFYQLSVVIFAFWISSYFSYPTDGALVTVLLNICFAIKFFCNAYFAGYKKNDNRNKNFDSVTSIGYSIKIFKNAVNKGDSIELFDIFTSENIAVLNCISISMASILIYIFFAICTDYILNLNQLRRSCADRKMKSQYKETVENNPKFRKRVISSSEEIKELKAEQGFFDWNEIPNLFKIKKDKVKYVYEEENDDIQTMDAKGKPVIKAINLFKKYKSDYELALDNVSLNIYNHELLIITGKPDSGKSTLMKTLCGYQASSYGKVFVDGKEMSPSRWKFICRKISVAPKKNGILMEDLSVEENIKLYASMGYNKEDGFKLLKELNFTGSVSDPVNKLNEEERTKIKVALVLMKSTPYAFIEEPTTYMSESDRFCFWRAIKTRKNKRTIIISTQNAEEAFFYGDRIVVLNDGAVQCIGNSEFVKNRVSISNYEPEIDITVHQM